MTNYILYNADANKDIIIRKISYNCCPYDAVWTGSKKGVGVIVYDPNTGDVSFNKLSGCNPYWWQILGAAICAIPPQEYTRRENRYKPFKISIKEGSSGALHLYMDTYYKTSMGMYIKDGKAVTLDVSMGEKLPDGLRIKFGDLIEFGRSLCDYFNMSFTRNPRWWKTGAQGLWKFEKLRDFELVDKVDYDPDDNK